MKYRLREREIEAVQFQSQIKPWPALVEPWPDEKGLQPRDMSWGYVDLAMGRYHIQEGDWIVTWPNSDVTIMKPDVFASLYEVAE